MSAAGLDPSERTHASARKRRAAAQGWVDARFPRPCAPKFSPATSVGIRGCVSCRKTIVKIWGQGPSTCEETLNLSYPHNLYDESVQVNLPCEL
eukprot:2627499-Prymnesium_polylepis.1